MRQSKKQWKAQWNGHFIRVESQNLAVKSETCLFVDGVCIHRNEGGVWSDNTCFESEFEDENGTHNVKVKVSESSLPQRCHIFINEELIGGDTHKKIALTEAETEALPVAEQRRLLKRQLFYTCMVVPAILLPFFYWINSHFGTSGFFFPYFYLFGMTVFNAIRTNRKLRKLPPDDNDKNPTPI